MVFGYLDSEKNHGTRFQPDKAETDVTRSQLILQAELI